MAENNLSTKSELVQEIRDLNRIRHTLVRCIDVCRQRIENEKRLRINAIENLKNVFADYDDFDKYPVSLGERTLDELIVDDPVIGKLVKECSNKEEADKLLQEIEIKLQRCCLIQYEVMTKFFPDEFKKCLTNVEKCPESIRTTEKVNPVVAEEKDESWADEWVRKFRPFSIVNESGSPLPTAGDNVENVQPKECVPTAERYMTLTVSGDAGEEVIASVADQRSGYEMMTLSPLSGVREHIYENILSDTSPDDSMTENSRSGSNNICEE